MQNSLVIGTRGSQLALWQAQFVKEQLENLYTGLEVQFKIIRTTGDTFPDRPLVGLGKGVFTKEIDIALLEGEIDLAVHSLKDLPTELPPRTLHHCDSEAGGSARCPHHRRRATFRRLAERREDRHYKSASKSTTPLYAFRLTSRSRPG